MLCIFFLMASILAAYFESWQQNLLIFSNLLSWANSWKDDPSKSVYNQIFHSWSMILITRQFPWTRVYYAAFGRWTLQALRPRDTGLNALYWKVLTRRNASSNLPFKCLDYSYGSIVWGFQECFMLPLIVLNICKTSKTRSELEAKLCWLAWKWREKPNIRL